MAGSNQITLTVRSTSGIWPDARFNVNNRAQKILDDGIRHFGLDPAPRAPYRLTQNGRVLDLSEKMEDLGLANGDTVLIEAGQPTDG